MAAQDAALGESPPSRAPPQGLPRPLQTIPNGVRNEIIAATGEFVGTFMFLFMGFVAAQVALDTSSGSIGPKPTSPAPAVGTMLYIAFAFGISLLVNAWVFFRVSGGMFNPAVTLALALNGSVTLQRAAISIVAQLVAGICAAAVVDGLTPGPLLIATTLGGEATIVQGLFLEMFLTAQLIITIFLLAVEKHRATPLAPIGIGLSLFVDHLAGIHFTGASMNPARSFGPAVVVGFPTYHWIYWVGPGLGSILAFGTFKTLKVLCYETANKGQDGIGMAAQASDTVIVYHEDTRSSTLGHRASHATAGPSTNGAGMQDPKLASAQYGTFVGSEPLDEPGPSRAE